jgi:hypothetical protein
LYIGVTLLDNAGNGYIAGNTSSFDFPITPGAADDSLTHEKYVLDPDAFISKFHFEFAQSSVQSGSNIPLPFLIASVSPNPFNPATTITFSLPAPSPATLAVYYVTGQKVATLLSGPQPAGSRAVRWDASNCASGVYFCRLEVDGKAVTRKLTLVK